jgi:hypothetical protein
LLYLGASACGETASEPDAEPTLMLPEPCEIVRTPPRPPLDIPECTPGSPDVVYPLPWESSRSSNALSDGTSLFVVGRRDRNPFETSLFRMDKRTQALTKMVDLVGPRRLVLYGDALLTIRGFPQQDLVRITKDGGSLSPVLPTLTRVRSFAAQGERIAVVRFDATSKLFLTISDGPGLPLTDIPITVDYVNNDPNFPLIPSVDLFGDDAYLFNYENVRRISLVTLEDDIVATPLSSSWLPVEGGMYGVDLTDYYLARLLWLPTGQSEPVTLDTANEVAVSNVIVDEFHVYWRVGADLRRYPRTGGSAESVMTGLERKYFLFSDEHCVYLATECETIRHSK